MWMDARVTSLRTTTTKLQSQSNSLSIYLSIYTCFAYIFNLIFVLIFSLISHACYSLDSTHSFYHGSC
ncbi:uncharacterized protein BDW47DRAFT_114128 [Aspergillus candidus]|uniref:Uncharacterized protein n=1 Tax=Aspergillus candidus TaxID=41067 RepID=A0A2I2EYA2_ASPCN|nr:hypothetical protein BDW47DRAFT_114128 [Aspergillus candidus]PLB33334.1 hypothetical protein BDW47DRAFT_114128 [Aspergillus candidus]